jgi:NADPH-dependent curcumin reductase CurA
MLKVVLARRPHVNPVAADFAIVEAERPEPAEGQMLVRTLWLSVDPYVRLTFDNPTIAGLPGMTLGDAPLGRAVSQVVASRLEGFSPGDIVEGRSHWAEYALVDGTMKPLKVDLGTLPLSYAVGALGMPGQTAYAGIVHVAKVKEGDTVVISAAAGAVGSQAGQIAKALGARVVGIAGGQAKCDAVKALGFDECVDYRGADFDAQLKAALPNGFNAYFENVGGDLTRQVFHHAAYGARVALCGVLAVYGTGEASGPDRLPELMRLIFTKGLTIQSFFGELLGGAGATEANRKLIEEGKLKPAEAVLQGIETLPEAYAGIFGGNGHVGKVVLHIADPE